MRIARVGVLSFASQKPLLPPLGVFMVRGLTPAFWLTVIATLIGWVPGIVLALLLLFVPERIPLR